MSGGDLMRALYEDWGARLALNPAMTLSETRAVFEEWHLPTREPTDVRYEQVDVDGTAAIWCIPDVHNEDRVILYLHGGGFVLGSMYSHRKLAGHIAKAAGARALVPNYRLAPEHPFPAAIENSVAIYRWLLDQDIPPDRIATVGDSAGGNLSITMVLQLRDEGAPLPAAIAVISPMLDMEFSGESITTRIETDALVTPDIADGLAKVFLGDIPRRHPMASPLHADLTGLPPVHIEVGGNEALFSDSERFAVLAEKAGGVVELIEVPGMQHVFPLMAGNHQAADEAVARIGSFLRGRLGG